MESPLVLVGWDYRQTPVELRERLAFSPDKVREALAAMRQEGLLSEGVILSTCNRSEVYGVTGGGLAGRDPIAAVTQFVSRFHGVPHEEIEGAGYRFSGTEAVRHLLRVASGLESLALGEDQIIGQVREAFRVASGAGATRAVLHRLFQKALETGKRVRSETGLSSRPISIPGVAIELAQKIFEDLAPRKFLILGAGETSSIFYDLLLARGAKNIEVVNRTLAKSEALCRRGQGPVPKPPRAALGAPGGVPQERRNERSGSTRIEPDAVEGRPPPQPEGTTPGGRSAASGPLNDELHRPAGPSLRSIPPDDVAAHGGFGTGPRALPWEDLASRLPHADVVISATSAQTPVLPLEMARKALSQRRGQPLFFLDLGIPRNVDPKVASLENAFLYAVDDLQEIAERNRQERQKEIGPAVAILEEEIDKFFSWFGALAVVPTITALRQKFETVRETEFDARLNQLSHIPEADREKIRLMAQSMVRSLLRSPTDAIKDEPDPGRRLDRAEVARHLFDLDVRGE